MRWRREDERSLPPAERRRQPESVGVDGVHDVVGSRVAVRCVNGIFELHEVRMADLITARAHG
jgi:hypothetical protein